MSIFNISLNFKQSGIVHTNLHFANKQLLSSVTMQEFSVSSLPGTVDVLTTELVIDKGEDSADDRLAFIRPEEPLMFRSRNKPQILIIECDLDRDDPGYGQERFRIRSLSCGRPDLIDAVYVRYPDDRGWEPLIAWQDIDSQIVAIMILFNMRTDIKTEHFPLALKVLDMNTGLTRDCDPGMGNDPPHTVQ